MPLNWDMNKATPINPIKIPTPYDDYIYTSDIVEALNSNFLSDEDRTNLEQFLDQIRDYVVDWEYGQSMIRESEFTDYTQELAYDLGVQYLGDWPYTHIDWNSAADELKHDYAAIDFNGITYYGRMG